MTIRRERDFCGVQFTLREIMIVKWFYRSKKNKSILLGNYQNIDDHSGN